MSNLFETANDVINLSNTMLEGLQHIAQQMEEGQLGETLFLFEDVLEAFALIQNSMGLLLAKEKQGELEVSSRELRDSMERLARAYEQGSLEKARLEVQSNLLTAFHKWQDQLQSSLKQYLES